MSLEDVERIMADTQDAIEYQRVRLYICGSVMIVVFRRLMNCLVKI